VVAQIGDIALLPNGAGTLARVVAVHPLFRASDKDQVSSVQYEAQVNPRAIPPGARAVGVPLAGQGGGTAADTLLGAQEQGGASTSVGQPTSQTTNAVQRTADPIREPHEMTTQERGELQQVQARDAAVRDEEETHAAVAGAFAGAPQYEYQQGPDGRSYVVNGSVPIRFSSAAVANPEQAELALQAIRASAQSPEAPSAADMQVFQQANEMSSSAARKYSAAGSLEPQDKQQHDLFASA
jgi:hypothetical protein